MTTKLLAIIGICASLSGCVTYVHHFEPGKGTTICANAAGCKTVP